MSTKYKFLDPEGIYFVSFATVGWVDIFTRIEYKEIFVDSPTLGVGYSYAEEFCWLRYQSRKKDTTKR